MKEIPKFISKFQLNAPDFGISVNKMTIQSPVPLRTTVYEANTRCCMICAHATQKTAQLRQSGVFDCSVFKPCHCYVSTHPMKWECSLRTLDHILERWHVTIFETEEQAIERAKEIAKEHYDYLVSIGVRFDENGMYTEQGATQ